MIEKIYYGKNLKTDMGGTKKELKVLNIKQECYLWADNLIGCTNMTCLPR